MKHQHQESANTSNISTPTSNRLPPPPNLTPDQKYACAGLICILIDKQLKKLESQLEKKNLWKSLIFTQKTTQNNDNNNDASEHQNTQEKENEEEKKKRELLERMTGTQEDIKEMEGSMARWIKDLKGKGEKDRTPLRHPAILDYQRWGRELLVRYDSIHFYSTLFSYLF